jgi:hypothetical protein
MLFRLEVSYSELVQWPQLLQCEEETRLSAMI